MAHIESIFRYPVKGFTPEELACVVLEPGKCIAGDRCFAIENGHSSFDDHAPQHVSKWRLAVLATSPAIAAIRLHYDEVTSVLTPRANGRETIAVKLNDEDGRRALWDWLQGYLGKDILGTLRMLRVNGFRFVDDPEGEFH